MRSPVFRHAGSWRHAGTADGHPPNRTPEAVRGCPTRQEAESNHDERLYIQSAYALPDRAKMDQEMSSLLKISDGFRKFIISGQPSPMYQNDDGIMIMNIWDFLGLLHNPVAPLILTSI